jgi:O-antigen/teichoic acid export membrane protein
MRTSLLKNASVLTVSNVLSPVASMVLVLTIGRLRGAAELGGYSLVMSVFVLLESLAALGLPVVVTREVAKRPKEATTQFAAGCAVGLGIVLALLVLAVPGLLVWGGGTPVSVAMAILALAVLPSVITAFATAVLLALEHVTDFVSIDLVERSARAGLGSVAVLCGSGIVAVAWITLALRGLAALAYLWRLRRRGVALTTRVDRAVAGNLLREVPVLGMIPVVNTLYARADIFMLSLLVPLADVGLYGAALRVVDIARTFPSAFGRALYPKLSRLAGAPDDALRDVLRRATRHLLLAMGAAVVMLGGLADGVIGLLYGSGFSSAAPCLRILAWGLLPYAIACTVSNVLFASGWQVADLRVNLICLAVAPLLQLALVPALGIQGAALAMGLGMALYGALQCFFLRRLVLEPALGRLVLRLGTVTLVAFVVARILGGIHPIAGTLAGLATYLIGVGIGGLFTPDDRSEMRELLSAASERLGARRAA